MERILQIKGMSCMHCAIRVEKALNKIEGVEATVDLDSNTAKVSLNPNVNEATIKEAVEDAGYKVLSIF